MKLPSYSGWGKVALRISEEGCCLLDEGPHSCSPDPLGSLSHVHIFHLDFSYYNLTSGIGLSHMFVISATVISFGFKCSEMSGQFQGCDKIAGFWPGVHLGFDLSRRWLGSPRRSWSWKLGSTMMSLIVYKYSGGRYTLMRYFTTVSVHCALTTHHYYFFRGRSSRHVNMHACAHATSSIQSWKKAGLTQNYLLPKKRRKKNPLKSTGRTGHLSYR